MKDNNNNGLKNHYTIIIIGSGIAGLSMCLHLLNKIPDFIGKIAVVEPKSTKRNYYLQQEYKCNEGTSEVSDDSFFENNIPQFHYPKKLQETNSINDFFTSRDSINNKSKREKDLLKMVIEKGVAYYIGSILNVNLTNGDEIKTIELQIPTSTKDSYPDQASLNFIEITSHYLIDAYGILDNNRTNEVINEPKELQTLKHDNAWLRLNSTDDTCSFRFYTNYFQGNGYWIWCEPTEKEYTIGISYDKSIIHASSINTIESFLSFLKNNCTIVYNLIKSGEIIDFNKHTKKVHKSSTKKSSDNWCILNESITTINDQFYSNSMVLMAYNIEMICKLLHLKLIVNNEKEYKTRILLYNIGIKTVVNSFNIGFKDTQDTNTLSIMKSWKIYYETTIYFNFMFPIYFNCHSLFKQLFNVYDNSLSCHNELLSLLKVANDKKLIPTTKTTSTIINNNLIEKDNLPPNIKSLNIMLNSDEPNIVSLPDTIETIVFGIRYVGTLQSHYLPKNLKTLIFNMGCSSQFNSNSFNNLSATSSSIEKLVLSGRFNYPLSAYCLVGNSFKEIQFIGKYNLEINENVIPQSVTRLIFGDEFNKQIHGLPNSITHLEFGKSFNQELTSDWIPQNLKTLKLGQNFKQPIKQNVLPQSLEYLEYTSTSSGNKSNDNDNDSLGCGFYKVLTPFEKLLLPGSIPNGSCWVLINGLAISGPSVIDISGSSRYFNFKEKSLLFIHSEIKPLMIPFGVEIIKFHDDFDSLIRKNVIPLSTREIIIGKNYNRPLVIDALPNSLTSLIFDEESLFNHPLRKGTLPESLVNLKLGGQWNQPIQCNQLPNNLKQFELSDRFDSVIEPGSLPLTLERLVFSSSWNQPINQGVLPGNLKQLELGWSWNQQLLPNVLPSSLTKLTFGNAYDQVIPIGILPNSLVVLNIENFFPFKLLVNCDFIPSSVRKLKINTSPLFNPFTVPTFVENFKYLGSLSDLPKNGVVSIRNNNNNLKTLQFSSNFNDIINVNDLPSSITTLILSHKFNQPLQLDSLPPTLKIIKFGSYFNQRISPNILPSTIEYIEFSESYDQILEEHSIPPSCKVIAFDKSYKQPVTSNILPQSIELIIIKRWNTTNPFNFEIFDHDSILSQIKIITIPNNNTKQFYKSFK